MSDEPSPQKFPFYVRVMAVAFVLSLVVGPVGFVILMASACVLQVRRRAFDGDVIGLFIAGLACPLVCAIYRWGFKTWGRMNWPEEEPPMNR